MTWLEELVPGEADVARASLLRVSEELSGMGCWGWDPRGDRLMWSENLFRLYGLEPGELEPTLDYVLSRTHPEDREPLRQTLRLTREDNQPRELTYRVQMPDGSQRLLHAVVAVKVLPATGPVFVGSVRDVTERRRAEREIRMHVAVSEALSRWDGLESGGRRLLAGIGEAMGFSLGALWVPEHELLAPRVGWHEDPECDTLADIGRLRLGRGVGLAGAAWKAAHPVSIAGVPRESSYNFHTFALRHHLRGAVAIPAVHAGEVLAVLTFSARDELELTDRLHATLTGIAHELGAFLARRSAELMPSVLTPREREVLQLAASGCSGPEIARRLSLSPATIKTHFDHIYAKYGVPDRVAAVAKAVREGLIQ
jgi:PAS domain S-box-containing protein